MGSKRGAGSQQRKLQEQRALDLLRERKGWSSAGELGEVLGYASATLLPRLSALEERGLVERQGQGRSLEWRAT